MQNIKISVQHIAFM